MTDTAFRAKSETTSQIEKLPEGKETTRGEEIEIEVPYLNYEQQKGHPHSVDYFKLGDTWDDPRGGFAKEISIIEEYLQKKIEEGELPNSIKGIKEKLKNLEKMNNLNKEERPVVKIGVLSAYIKFLMETDKIKYNLRRYGKYGHY